MTGTGTSTSTVTSTVSRADFLTKVVKYIVKSTLGSHSMERVIEKGVHENEWVESIHIRGLDSLNKICAEIVLRIDWDRHRLYVKNGQDELHYDTRKTPADNLSKKVDAMIDVYSEIVAEQGLRGECAITFREGIDRARARMELGTSPSERKWKEGTVSHVGGINDKKLDEFFADLSVVVQDDEKDARKGIVRGVISGYFERRGYGFIHPEKAVDEKDVFFHISNVVNRDRLAEGAAVNFAIELGAKGPRAVNVQVV